MRARPWGPEDTTIGIDLGGTKLAFAAVNSEGRISLGDRVPTRQTAAEVLEDIVATVQRMRAAVPSPVRAVGIGVAGQVDDHSGAVRFAPNLQWRDVPLRAELERQLGLPVHVTNDVRAATWGEWLHGAGRGIQDLVCVFVGTGIGGGIITGGRMLKGCSNTAGEIGHIRVVANGRECSCGGRGCMEAYAGGWALAAQAQASLKNNPDEGRRLLERTGSVEAVTAATVGRAFVNGDTFARRIVTEAVTHLAAGLVSIVNTLNPCRIILGGGVVQGMPQLVEDVDRLVRRQALDSALVHLQIVPSELMEVAGTVGAAAAARLSLQSGTDDRIKPDPAPSESEAEGGK